MNEGQIANFRHPLSAVWGFAGNLFFQDSQPWVVLKSEPAKCNTILACCVGLVRILAVLLEPYMPTVAAKLCEQLGACQQLGQTPPRLRLGYCGAQAERSVS